MMNVAIDGQKGAENTLGRSLEPTEFYEVLRTLLSKDAELPVLRESDDRIMLDLSSASRLLGEILIDSVPDGQVQDRRGKLLFEPQVQALINESPWTPSNSLLQIRNRKLLLSGTDQTDFDAVGERDGTVLLISCRAIRKGEEYFHGDWRAIRNARLRVEASVHQWIGKTNKLWECRIGDNFDLSKYSEMIAVVCTPTPLYVQDPPALQEVRPGLRRYTTAGELEEWLHFGNVIGKECGGSLRESFDTTMSEPRRPRRG